MSPPTSLTSDDYSYGPYTSSAQAGQSLAREFTLSTCIFCWTNAQKVTWWQWCSRSSHSRCLLVWHINGVWHSGPCCPRWWHQLHGWVNSYELRGPRFHRFQILFFFGSKIRSRSKLSRSILEAELQQIDGDKTVASSPTEEKSMQV